MIFKSSKQRKAVMSQLNSSSSRSNIPVAPSPPSKAEERQYLLKRQKYYLDNYIKAKDEFRVIGKNSRLEHPDYYWRNYKDVSKKLKKLK